MSKYIDINNYTPSEPREDDMPSCTVEGEFKEMSDILNGILNGTPHEQKKVQYISAEDASHITSFYRNSLDLTDLDAMKSHNDYQRKVINDAIKQRNKELQEQIVSEKVDTEQNTGNV